MMKEKNALRQEYRNVRDGISNAIRNIQNDIIYQKFIGLKEYKQAETIFIYASFGSEVETKKIIEKIISDRKNAVIPKCDTKGRTMRAFMIKDLTQLRKGAYGIKEPCESCKEVSKEQIDLAVVPGICFDLKGNRLGYGGGYYDKFLADFKGFSVGLAYNECIADEVPAEEHDCKLDLIISANEVR